MPVPPYVTKSAAELPAVGVATTQGDTIPLVSNVPPLVNVTNSLVFKKPVCGVMTKALPAPPRTKLPAANVVVLVGPAPELSTIRLAAPTLLGLAAAIVRSPIE